MLWIEGLVDKSGIPSVTMQPTAPLYVTCTKVSMIPTVSFLAKDIYLSVYVAYVIDVVFRRIVLCLSPCALPDIA